MTRRLRYVVADYRKKYNAHLNYLISIVPREGMADKERKKSGGQCHNRQRDRRTMARCNNAVELARKETERAQIEAANEAIALQESLDEARRCADKKQQRCHEIRRELVADQEDREATQAELAVKERKITELIDYQKDRKFEMQRIVESQANVEEQAERYRSRLEKSKDTSERLRKKIDGLQNTVQSAIFLILQQVVPLPAVQFLEQALSGIVWMRILGIPCCSLED